ncbi:MAG: NADP-dependent oxidoreductase [Actinomycetota bacterium]|nr:NADP-dependent oxidoreductase [Actinomycetota bacterium]
MLALQYQAFGGPDLLEVAEAVEPHAESGQIRVAVRAASVNPLDWKLLSGAMSGGEALEGPGMLGFDASGVVDEVGDGVSGVSVGDEVFGTGQNTDAQFAVLDAWAAEPPSLDWAMAAAAGVAGETAERVLRLLGVAGGDTVFIDGGAGGVGAVTVQVAVARGLRVVASAGPDNQDYLRAIGATPVLYGDCVAERVRATADARIAGVVDVAGKTPIDVLIGLVEQPRQVVTIANFGAGESGVQITGGGADARPFDALAETAGLLEQGKLVIKVQTFPMDRAAEAFAVSQAGHVRGKLVLLP